MRTNCLTACFIGVGILAGSQACAATLPHFSRYGVAVDGAEISYLRRPGAGPVLVLIPGSLVGADDFAEVVQALDARLSIVIVELRGHGESWPPPRGGTIEQFASDVLAAVDHAGVKRFYAGGHSIGGMIAIEIAGRRPDAILGVIAMEGWTHYSVAQDAFGGQNDLTLSVEQQARKTKLREPVTSRWTKEQIAEFTSIWRKWNGYEILRTTPVPVLELWGDRRRPQPSLAQMKIPDRPNIEVQWIRGVSHYLPIESPREAGEAVNRFIERTGRAAPQGR